MMEIFLLVILFILSAFFSAAESALTSLSRLRVSRMVEQKIVGARLVRRLKENPSEFLSTILIGNNLVNVAAAALATSIAIRFLEARGWGNIGVAIGVATGAMTFLILVFGEITPKTVAIANAEKVSIFVAPIVIFLQPVLKPIAYFVGFISRPFILFLRGKTPEKGPFITEEEIRMILAAGEKEGVLEKDERAMITSIFEFEETVVREVMTPRPDITAAEAGRSREEIINVILESGHSRIPIYEINLDNVIGVIYAKDLLRSGDDKIKDALRPAIFVPETKKIADLMHEMQAARTHFAVIVDEYGMTSGVVTLEDLIEEIVGEIHDEFERDEKMIVRPDQNTIIVDGRLSVPDLNDQLELNLSEEEYDTIGGFVFGQLGKAPSVGDVVRYENLLISVERIHRRRISRIKIIKIQRSGEEAVGG